MARTALLFSIMVAFTLAGCQSSFGTNSTKSSKPPAKNGKTLAVDLIPQQAPNWCWAACGEMVMRYLQKKYSTTQMQKCIVEQCKQADAWVNTSTTCCALLTYCSSGTSNNKKLSSASDYYGYEDCNHTAQEPLPISYPTSQCLTSKISNNNKPLTWDQVKTEIDSGRPFVYGEKNLWHFKVVIGYYESNGKEWLVVNDPSPVCTGANGKAADLWYSMYKDAMWKTYSCIRPVGAPCPSECAPCN